MSYCTLPHVAIWLTASFSSTAGKFTPMTRCRNTITLTLDPISKHLLHTTIMRHLIETARRHSLLFADHCTTCRNRHRVAPPVPQKVKDIVWLNHNRIVRQPSVASPNGYWAYGDHQDHAWPQLLPSAEVILEVARPSTAFI